MTWTLRNPNIQGGETLRLNQPLTVVIAGSRVVSAELGTPGSKTFRVGTRPRATVELESVEVGSSPTGRLDPGWWLQLFQKTRKGGDLVLARLPLPFELGKATEPDVFPMPDDPSSRFWDAAGMPAGYDRVEDWKDELIFQRLVPGSNLTGRDQVRIHRHTVITDLPDCFRPGELRGVVSRKSDASAAAVASKALGPVDVLSGLRASTDSPLTGETVEVEAVIDLGAAPYSRTKPEALPEVISAEVWKKDPGSRKLAPAGSVDLQIQRQADPLNKPELVRYLGDLGREDDAFGEPGEYQLRFYTGERASPEAEPTPAGPRIKTAPPGGWVGDLRDVTLTLRVLVEGNPEPTPFDSDNALKVFTDLQPFWWVSGEPGFPAPFENERTPRGTDPGQGKFQVVTAQALGFRWPESGDAKSMSLRYQGVFHDPARGDPPTTVMKRYPNGVAPNPNVEVRRWGGDSGLTAEAAREVGRGEFTPLNGSRQYLDIHVDLNALDAAQRDRARKPEERPLLARFAVVGIDRGGRPFGRVFHRPFVVSVRSLWDELGDAVPWEVVVLVAAILAFAVVVLYKRFAKKTRKAHAPRPTHDPSETGPTDEGDYLSGLGPTSDGPDHHRHARPATPPASDAHPGAPPPPSSPTQEPRYVEGDLSEPGGDAGGPSYLD